MFLRAASVISFIVSSILAVGLVAHADSITQPPAILLQETSVSPTALTQGSPVSMHAVFAVRPTDGARGSAGPFDFQVEWSISGIPENPSHPVITIGPVTTEVAPPFEYVEVPGPGKCMMNYIRVEGETSYSGILPDGRLLPNDRYALTFTATLYKAGSKQRLDSLGATTDSLVVFFGMPSQKQRQASAALLTEDFLASPHCFFDRATRGTVCTSLSPDTTFSELRRNADESGYSHVRYQEFYRGVPVFKRQQIFEIDDLVGKVANITDSSIQGLSLDVNPTLDSAAALAVAANDVGTDVEYIADPTSELVVYATDEIQPVLAYHVRNAFLQNGQTKGFDYMIDAKNGNIVQKSNGLTMVTDTAATGDGQTQYEGLVDLDTAYNTAGQFYSLTDTTRGSGVHNKTRDLAHATSGTGALYTDTDNTWGDFQNYSSGSTTSARGQTSAAEAHYGLQITWDYFLNFHQWNGVFGDGQPTFSRIHYGTNEKNAYWDLGGCNCATFGDGGGSYGTITSLDIVAHEFTHGVSEAVLVGGFGGKEGKALSEATSDIFGASAEFWANTSASKNPPTGDPGDWKIGEEIGPVVRYLNKPSLTGGSDLWDSCLYAQEPHKAGGPASLFFYYLTTGVPQGPAGIGLNAARNIYFTALRDHMTPTAGYRGLRTATLQAAVGATKYNAVNAAWQAVNVTDQSIPGPWTECGAGADDCNICF
jgi:Zn-dependent metalloprotease